MKKNSKPDRKQKTSPQGANGAPAELPSATVPSVVPQTAGANAAKPVRSDASPAGTDPDTADKERKRSAASKNKRSRKDDVTVPRSSVEQPYYKTDEEKAAEAEEAAGDKKTVGAEKPSDVKSDVNKIADADNGEDGFTDEPVPAKKPAKRRSHVSKTVAEPLPDPIDEGMNEALDDSIADDYSEELPIDAPDAFSDDADAIPGDAKSGREKQTIPPMEILRRHGYSEEDVAMIFELDYENELGRLVGYENLKRLKNEYLKKDSSDQAHHYRTAYGYRGEENPDAANRKALLAAYRHDRKNLIRRTILTAVFCFLLIFADFPELFGSLLTGYAERYPLVFMGAGLALLFGVAALSFRQIFAGIRSVFRFVPTPYSIPAVLLPFIAVYDVLVMCLGAECPPLNLVTALFFCLLSVCDLIRVGSEIRALRLLATDGVKNVLEPAVSRKKKLRKGDKLVKILNDDVGENFYNLQQAKHVAGFYRRCNDTDTMARPLTILLCAEFGFAVVFALLAAILTESFTEALSMFGKLLTVTSPICCIPLFFLPLTRANKILARRNCMLIGEESVREFSVPQTVIFHDSELYGAQTSADVSVWGSDDMRHDLKLAAILFRKIGGALEQITDPAPANGQKDPHVHLVRVTEAGIEATVDGNCHLLAGSAAFMKHSGIRVPRESTDRTLSRADNVSLLYFAVDGVLKLRYEIEYRSRPKFESLLRDLHSMDTSAAIRSYDPNLNEAFTRISRKDDAVPVRVIKPGRYEPEQIPETSDVGVVSLGKPFDLFHAVRAAKRIRALRYVGVRLQLIVSLLGVAGVLFSYAIPGAETLRNSGLAILIWQILWVTVGQALCALFINRRSLHMKR